MVDDEISFREGLRVALEAEGFAVDLASDGHEALDRHHAGDHDLILLDVMLPRMSGIDVCREIRRTSQIPIIMVSARREEIDAVVGLEVGADDYVAKPYRIRELVARMRTVLRRTSARPDQQPATGLITVGGVTLDPDRHEVTARGEPIQLRLKEFDLLKVLLENAGIVVTRQTLIDMVWGYDYVGDTRTLDVHIKRLRAKIEVDPAHPREITTVRGLGYKYIG